MKEQQGAPCRLERKTRFSQQNFLGKANCKILWVSPVDVRDFRNFEGKTLIRNMMELNIFQK